MRLSTKLHRGREKRSFGSSFFEIYFRILKFSKALEKA